MTNYNSIIIDDTDFHGVLMKTIIESNFKEMEIEAVIEDGQEGYNYAEKNRPDFLFIDYHLPGLVGSQIVEKVREIKNYYPIIIMYSSDDNPEIIRESYQLGANEFSVKGDSFDVYNMIKKYI